MNRLLQAGLTGLLLAVLAAVSADENGAPKPTTSVFELMQTVVVPASDTLWGIEDPQTDDDWQVFVDAAQALIVASETIKQGGTGPNDAAWAASPDWQAFADRLLAASTAAKAAAEQRDLDGMFSAGDVLYPPCEECHLQFNPGVQ
jgi:cytochrome c556